MSIRGGPDIIEDGLVLHLDAAEPLCFRGEPTTNLISDPFMVNGSPSPLVMAYEGTGTVTSDLPDSSMSNVSNKWMKVVKNSSTNGRMLFLGLSGLTVGVDYCFSAYIYTNDINLTAIYPNSDNVSVSPIYSSIAYNLSNRGTIQRVQCIFRTTYGATSIGIRVGSTNPIGSTFYFTGIQVEQKSYPTRVANGTRGSTVATGGGLLDLTNNGNDGTINRTASPSAGFYNASNGGSFVFDGNNDRIDCGDIIKGRTTFSASVWMKSSDTRTGSNSTYKNPSIFGTQHGSGATGDFALTVKAGKLGFYAELPTSGYRDSNVTVCDNIWHYVVVTKTTDGVIKLYVDGQVVYSNSGFTSSIRTSDLQYYNWELGRAYWYGEDSSMLRYNGLIAMHSLYDRELLPSEILQNYNATKGRFGL